MGRTYDSLDERLSSFVAGQPLFFVATAPLEGGHVNCSPKSNNGELSVRGPREVAFLDRTGSGAETIAHLREPGNGRIVLMFCAFEGPPRVLRLHGRGEVVGRDDRRFVELSGSFRPESLEGARSVVVVTVERIADSCGYGVPLMSFEGHRPQADEWHARKGEEGIRAYWEEKNSKSIDGLPALEATRPAAPPISLRPMTEEEYAELMDRQVAGYAASHVAAGDWSAEEADEKARQEVGSLLPDGLATAGMVLRTAESEGRPIGRFWLARDVPRPGDGWLYFIEVDKAERNRGLGRALLGAVEEECARSGLCSLGLNVFGINASARHLYASAGYETTSLQMRKAIS